METHGNFDDISIVVVSTSKNAGDTFEGVPVKDTFSVISRFSPGRRINDSPMDHDSKLSGNGLNVPGVFADGEDSVEIIFHPFLVILLEKNNLSRWVDGRPQADRGGARDAMINTAIDRPV